MLLVQKVARTSPSMARQRQFSLGPTCLAMPWRSWWFLSDFDSISLLIDAYLDAKLCSIHLAVSTLEAFGICYTAHIVGILCIGFIGDVTARCGGSVHSWQPLQAFERQVAKHCYVYSFLPHCCIDFTLLVQKVQWVNKRRKHSFARWQERTLTRWTTSFEQWKRNWVDRWPPLNRNFVQSIFKVPERKLSAFAPKGLKKLYYKCPSACTLKHLQNGIICEIRIHCADFCLILCHFLGHARQSVSSLLQASVNGFPHGLKSHHNITFSWPYKVQLQVETLCTHCNMFV